jgi:hypothetical protein
VVSGKAKEVREITMTTFDHNVDDVNPTTTAVV